MSNDKTEQELDATGPPDPDPDGGKPPTSSRVTRRRRWFLPFGRRHEEPPEDKGAHFLDATGWDDTDLDLGEPPTGGYNEALGSQSERVDRILRGEEPPPIKPSDV